MNGSARRPNSTMGVVKPIKPICNIGYFPSAKTRCSAATAELAESAVP